MKEGLPTYIHLLLILQNITWVLDSRATNNLVEDDIHVVNKYEFVGTVQRNFPHATQPIQGNALTNCYRSNDTYPR
jgi:hypothetical protein